MTAPRLCALALQLCSCRFLAIRWVADQIAKLGSNLFYRIHCDAASHTVDQRRRVVHYLALGDVEPPRQRDRLSRQRLGNYAIEFVFWPAAFKESPGKHHRAEPAVRQLLVDLTPQAIAYTKYGFVVPDTQPGVAQSDGKGPHDLVLSFRRVPDEQNETPLVRRIDSWNFLLRDIPDQREKVAKRSLIDRGQRLLSLRRNDTDAGSDRAAQALHVHGDMPRP